MVFTYKGNALLDQSEILRTAQQLHDYVERLNNVATHGGYEADEASLNLPMDKNILAEVQVLKKEKESAKLKYLVVVGIGGSNLGAKAVYDALYGQFDLLEPDRYPKMIFADTCDPEFLTRLQTFLQEQVSRPEEILINMISKSGGTTETAVNAEIIMSIFENRFKNKAWDRLIVTTDEGSKLWKMAAEKGWSRLSIPAKVGGRYSFFSGVGLFPLSFLELDIKDLLNGAQKMRKVCLNRDLSDNPAALSATILYLHRQKGKMINDNFFFHPELESLGKWYRQLMGESVGKEKDLSGNTVNAGITPTVSIGSIDLHSMGQLYLGGPADKFTTFISAASLKRPKVPAKPLFSGLVSHVENKSSAAVMEAILSGVMAAYQKKPLPYCQVAMEGISEGELAAFMQFKMMEMMMLGRLLNVNPFDQPSVEDYKVETKKILAGA